MRLAINRNAAFHTGPHTAKRASRSTGDRAAKPSDPSLCDRYRNECVGGNCYTFAIYLQMYVISHQMFLTSFRIVTVHTGKPELP